MVDPRDPRTEPGTGGAVPGARPGLPRWVKVSGIAVGILVLALVAILLIGGGNHGPMRHAVGITDV
ncbi:MAG: hypothetical protein H0U35_04975 [Sporichthyaceae bacterium]|nr:hypothetical protein [Sporichthyaceae bacterium]